MKLQITCDRCGQTVEGMTSTFDYQGRLIETTSGFYDVAGPKEKGGWALYAQSGESRICDACMWSDPLYQQTHFVVKTESK
jgi:hypothetical protein